MKSDGIIDFLKSNAWSLLVLIFIAGGFATMVSLKFSEVQAQVDENSEKIESLTRLVERVIILEEHDKNFTDDMIEIKQDLKEIKASITRLPQ